MSYSADQKPLELTALTSLANDDTIIVGDTSDTSEVAKSITFANFEAGLALAGAYIDGGTASSNYGAITAIDGGTA